MMKNIALMCLACSTLTLVNGCKKDKLKGDLEEFKGRYVWVEYRYRDNWWDSGLTSRPASNYDFTAEIEFDHNGKVHFYIDGKEIHETGFRIEDEGVYDDGQIKYLTINPRIEDTEDIDLNNTVDFWLINDSLHCDDFPGESYDQNLGGEHVFRRK